MQSNMLPNDTIAHGELLECFVLLWGTPGRWREDPAANDVNFGRARILKVGGRVDG